MSRVRGFTLLEVLLATVLMAVLMTGIWALVGTYQRLFAVGEASTEQSQLVRTLLEQFSDDLHSAIPDSATGMPGASASVRRFGLFGTERALQVDVLQVTPAQGISASMSRGQLPLGLQRGPQVPELHTVQYWFEEPFERQRPGRGCNAGAGPPRTRLGDALGRNRRGSRAARDPPQGRSPKTPPKATPRPRSTRCRSSRRAPTEGWSRTRRMRRSSGPRR